MKVWTYLDGSTTNVGYRDIEIGQRATVHRLGGFLGLSSFGELATLTRTTKRHLIWTTDSGAEVKTSLDNLFRTAGKAAKAGYSVTLHEVKDLIRENVRYWNDKTLCLEKK